MRRQRGKEIKYERIMETCQAAEPVIQNSVASYLSTDAERQQVRPRAHFFLVLLK